MTARYIVLGLREDAETWRREHGLSPRDVIHVSTTSAHALRGLTGHFEVITLESWGQASPRVVEAVRRDLALIGLVSDPPPP